MYESSDAQDNWDVPVFAEHTIPFIIVLQCGIFVEHATVKSWRQLISAFLDLF